MKWQGRRGSRNIQDRRLGGRSGSRRAGGGSGRAKAGGLGIVAVVVIGYFLGVDLTPLLDDRGFGGFPTGDQTGFETGFETGQPVELTAADARVAQFVSVTLADTEDVWAEIFADQLGRTYAPPVLVLFKGQTRSACGGASAATGPFYCPPERMAYLDTDFFITLDRQLGAGGDFAAAYVVAHEVAHHVQNELGILGQVNQRRGQVSQEASAALSVRVELQADCFAGIWARRAQEQFDSLEPGDIAEAMNAAARIGDDTLARNAGRTVQPHTFTHGSSAQRQRWFARGYDSGDLSQCDTFNTDRL